MSRRRWSLPVLVVLVLAGAAACGGDDDAGVDAGGGGVAAGDDGATGDDASGGDGVAGNDDGATGDDAGSDGASGGGDPPGGDVGGADLVGRTFLSTSVTVDGQPSALVDGTRVRLELHDDGRLTASAGCNTLGATLSLDGDRFVLDGISTTEMGCDPALHAQDDWLAGFLGAGPTWALDGATLRLESGATVMELVDREVAEPDRPLESTTWRLEATVTGTGAVASLPAGTGATIVLAEGRLSVEVDGCNSGGAAVEVGDGVLVLGPLAMTRMGCTEPVATVEAAVVAVLDGEAVFSIEADVLTLDHPGGAGLVLRAQA